MTYLLEGRTTFVIAHRLSTIRRANQILVVEDGRIVERGTHTSLYAKGGRYYELYTQQHGMDANLFLAQDQPGQTAGSDPELDPVPMEPLSIIDSLKDFQPRPSGDPVGRLGSHS